MGSNKQLQDDEPLRDDAWLAQYLHCERKTAQAWRTRGNGPPLRKIKFDG